jgi:hypothetical protein
MNAVMPLLVSNYGLAFLEAKGLSKCEIKSTLMAIWQMASCTIGPENDDSTYLVFVDIVLTAKYDSRIPLKDIPTKHDSWGYVNSESLGFQIGFMVNQGLFQTSSSIHGIRRTRMIVEDALKLMSTKVQEYADLNKRPPPKLIDKKKQTTFIQNALFLSLLSKSVRDTIIFIE